MRQKIILFIFLFIGAKILFGQNNNEKAFTDYANQQFNLMVKAYDNKDTAAFRITMEEFLVNLNKLDINKQKDYESYMCDVYYYFSCLYSLTGNKVKALDYLEKSRFSDYNHLLLDTDMDNIRNEKRFKAYLKYTKKHGIESHLETLKKGAKYNYKDKREITKVTYKSMNDSNLVLMRKTFKLDSIAGTGDEILQILNILHWVHNTFAFDGTKGIPEFNSTTDLMNKCIKENKSLFCGAMSWVLSDCYLAMGFKSRQVVCLPKDSADMECHSINTVYSHTLNKWIWVDATSNSYVMNEKGELLSIAEVRERLINGKPLILNPDANWNNSISVKKENYLYDYMAKNLYAIQCFTTGGGENKSNLLVPTEYKGIHPQTAGNKPKCTNNPDVFWAKPE